MMIMKTITIIQTMKIVIMTIIIILSIIMIMIIIKQIMIIISIALQRRKGVRTSGRHRAASREGGANPKYLRMTTDINLNVYRLNDLPLLSRIEEDVNP